MRYLFIHPVFPGQFHQLMASLAADPAHEVWHLSQQSALSSIKGVRKLHYKMPDLSENTAHPFLHQLHLALQHGDAITRALIQLKKQGYQPDIIYCYAGWGQGLFLKDVFPQTPVVGYFEWYLNAFNAEYNFAPDALLEFDRQRLLRLNNANILLDLCNFDAGVTPTHWQKQQFPKEFHSKLHVHHDGVDTTLYAPHTANTLTLPDHSVLTLHDIELVTYCTRGMEPFRGFPQFMRALVQVQQARPNCHAIIVGTENNYYSRQLPNQQSYKQTLLTELAGQLDLSRIHFTGWLQPTDYLKVLQASNVHVYLTYPYVLSWSLLEAMSCACLVIGSATAPVTELIQEGINGKLVDFFAHHQLANSLIDALAVPEKYTPLRLAARDTVLSRYALTQTLPPHMALLQQIATSQPYQEPMPKPQK